MDLMHKGVKKVANVMRKNGFIIACDYDNGENHIVEFSKVAAGITIKSVVITFSKCWKVIDFKEV